ncbi:MAG: TIGR01440 family protein [Clostridiales bacterium]|nr:TIGR01440 family protein [Clostridiales bacterium]
MEKNIELIKSQLTLAAEELLRAADLKSGQIVLVGCSSSEILGHEIGTDSVPEVGKAVFDALNRALKAKGIFLVAQCCEHLNRAIVIESRALMGAQMVNVVPAPDAGGSFATAAYRAFERPLVIENIQADAGLDIGDTLIGMHLKPIAVPLRLSIKKIGQANLTAARTRPKYIGGPRAKYDDALR